MDVRFSIALPREAYTVAVVRVSLGQALRAGGICADCRSDILTAASEACANVIDHGHPATSYEVAAWLRGDTCVLEVGSMGPAFDPGSVRPPGPDAESGRGLLLMHTLVDTVEFGRSPSGLAVVRMRRRFDPACRCGARAPRPRSAKV
ncbi:serine/threonine-protein kinase RsbW [Murinocardiopsis flavida]|uniref:Serine/threonine-protein kinase RsbW n=1 Tax=Murinocardiopsis flavida TaxID=645275 RepID=A0A2P8DQJ7_9ACTN|nr:ATP-binding protein [Murinocardiopsis flavida]PSK99495.1 serine/threonine-protein kinase RsbW [Murinocardiopsis flavida]